MRQNSDSSNLVTNLSLEVKLDDVKRDIDDKVREYRDQILTKLDGVIGRTRNHKKSRPGFTPRQFR